MIKIIKNNRIIDVCPKEVYLRYVPEIGRYIKTDFQDANAVLGSDQNTVYHLANTDFNFDSEPISARVEKISREEYERLLNNVETQQEEDNKTLKAEIDNLKEIANSQKALIEELIKRLN